MDTALLEASLVASDVPVGAALFDKSGELVGVSRNSREAKGRLIGHAESNVIGEAWESGKCGSLDGFTLISTLEPCIVCAGIIRETGIVRVVYGASNPQRGAGGSVYDLLRDKRLGRPVEVVAGIRAEECHKLLDDFFAQLRKESL
ncbi:nucleoside deaminase [Aquiluna sp.]|nr:nucleoside deaminase [Aquiluna sp.]